jgi:hypothetical protein
MSMRDQPRTNRVDVPDALVRDHAAIEVPDDLVHVNDDPALRIVGACLRLDAGSVVSNCRDQYSRTCSRPCNLAPSTALGQSTSGWRPASAASRSRALKAA